MMEKHEAATLILIKINSKKKKAKYRIVHTYYFCKPLIYIFICLYMQELPRQGNLRYGRKLGTKSEYLPCQPTQRKITIFNGKSKYKGKSKAKLNYVKVREFKILAITIKSIYYITM